jgi:acyl-CoA synthetase (AMP-forming)/AMP-acid ligase II
MLTQRLRQLSTAYPNRFALEERGACLSYKQMWEAVDDITDLFVSLGIGPEQVVAVCARNSIAVALTFLAIWNIGGVVYPLRVKHAMGLRQILDGGCSPDAILLEGKLETESILGKRYSDGGLLPRLGLRMWRSVEKGRSIGEIAVSPKTVLWLPTSGSSAAPKIICLGLEGTFANIRANSESLGLNQNDKTLMWLPLSYGYGLVAQFLSHLYAGATIVFPPHANSAHFLAGLVRERKITTCFTVPALLRMLLFLASEESEVKSMLASLRLVTVGGDFLDWPSLDRAWTLIHPADLAITYGLSEAGPRVSTHYVRDRPTSSGCVGRPIDGVMVKIFDDKGIQLSPGSKGEIAVFGASVMQGYAGSENGRCFIPEEMVMTGDLGCYSATGDLYVLGRKSEVIEIDGCQVHLNQLKEELYAHSSVLHIDATLAHGCRPMIQLEVLTKPGEKVQLEELLSRCRAKWPALAEHIELTVTTGHGLRSANTNKWQCTK